MVQSAVPGRRGALGPAAADLATEGFADAPGHAWVGQAAKEATSRISSAAFPAALVSKSVHSCIRKIKVTTTNVLFKVFIAMVKIVARAPCNLSFLHSEAISLPL